MRMLWLLLMVSFVSADVKWVDSYKEAQKANKPIFVYISQKGCPACAYMNKTLQDKKIVEYLNKHFVCVKQDVHEPMHIPATLRSRRTPTLHFIGRDGRKLIESYIGGKNVEGLYRMLQNAAK